MAKTMIKPSEDLFPLPTVLVTVQEEGKAPNIITISWTGIVNSTPLMIYIAVQTKRHSYPMLKESMEFVINIPSEDLWQKSDYCGFVSGRNVDKFKETGLTPIPAGLVQAPLIKECPVNIECKVTQIIPLPSNHVFIAEVIAVHYDDEVLDDQGVPDMERIKAFSYCRGNYQANGRFLGLFGESRRK